MCNYVVNSITFSSRNSKLLRELHKKVLSCYDSALQGKNFVRVLLKSHGYLLPLGVDSRDHFSACDEFISSKRGVYYFSCETTTAWNENMIARILGYEAYIGTNTNPAIITAEQWRAADAAKPSTRKPHEQNSDVKTIRQLARCAQCGSRLTLGTNGQSWERWKCHACGALTAKAITPRIRESLSCLMSQLLNTPELIDEPECQETQDSTTDQEEALRDALNAPEFDEGFARQMAYAFAVAQFDRISSADYETIRIREILVKKDGMDDLNTTLLKEITAAVLIHPDGRVSLRLKNNQIIEGR